MVNVDMGAITETLFESELFGHTKGAFTDAKEERAGKFEAAHKGTLFLDEIGNLPLALQAKLLVVLQSRNIVKVGSNQPIPIDIRLITATNKDLQKMIADGLFREDLLYRINTITIEVPPLRERGNDVVLLAEFYLGKYGLKYNKPGIKITRKAAGKLLRHSWPGNVRELQHSIEKAVILADSDQLTEDSFALQAAKPAASHLHNKTIEEMEKEMIQAAIHKENGNMSAVAKKLGISRPTLYKKLKSLEE
jgi:transcriptional regulator with PAS, ATPase and Fis domain